MYYYDNVLLDDSYSVIIQAGEGGWVGGGAT